MKKNSIFLIIIFIGGLSFFLYKNEKLAIEKENGSDHKPKQSTQIMSTPIAEVQKIQDTTSVAPSPKINFEAYEKQIKNLNHQELNKKIIKIEHRLNKFSHLNYDEFSEEQLEEFNKLNEIKSVLLKKLIFIKYSNHNKFSKGEL